MYDDENEDEESEEDDGEGWINTNNITKYLHNASTEAEGEDNKLGISIMTTDYAMQVYFKILYLKN